MNERFKILQTLPKETLADYHLLEMPAHTPPWQKTGITLKKGQWFSWLAEGQIKWGREGTLGGGPRYHLWGRIGETGDIFKSPQDTLSMQADSDGALYLGIAFGYWKDQQGALGVPAEAYQAMEGGLNVAVMAWGAKALAGLKVLKSSGGSDPLVAAAIARLENPPMHPPGWEPLWEIGMSDAFFMAKDPGEFTRVGGVIQVEAADDMGIIKKPCHIPLTPETTLSWDWCVENLPVTVAEDTVPTHDYISIAVDFDNGRDLTYYWSAALAPDTHFHCPISHWHDRETHWVMRSGETGMGQWHSESRNLLADYQKAIGEPPGHIVAVWLIVVSIFNHGLAKAQFREINLTSPEHTRRIL